MVSERFSIDNPMCQKKLFPIELCGFIHALGWVPNPVWHLHFRRLQKPLSPTTFRKLLCPEIPCNSHILSCTSNFPNARNRRKVAVCKFQVFASILIASTVQAASYIVVICFESNYPEYVSSGKACFSHRHEQYLMKTKITKQLEDNQNLIRRSTLRNRTQLGCARMLSS
eukprot:6272554-Amphidinium_carterae.1